MNDELIAAAVEEQKLLNGEPWFPPGCTKLGSAGFVLLKDVMGCEQDIAVAARTSYSTGTKVVSSDLVLIRRLLRDGHTTPFEMVELKFLTMVPMDAWRQWVRHRTASINEYSTRYSVAIDEKAVTDPESWRLQSQVNKQGSGGYLVEWPSNVEVWRQNKYATKVETEKQADIDDNIVVLVKDDKGVIVRSFLFPAIRFAGCGFLMIPTPGELLSITEAHFHGEADDVYQLRLALGVAREQARKDLPLSTYTRAYWKLNLHNFLHFSGLRRDSHAQLEIREYADAMFEMVRLRFPNVCKAWEQYRFSALTLTELDQVVVVECVNGHAVNIEELKTLLSSVFDNKQEMKECLMKLNKLKIQTWGLSL